MTLEFNDEGAIMNRKRAKLSPLLAITFLLATPAGAAASTDRSGEAAFAKCLPCHALRADAGPKVGPHLQGIYGRGAATLKSFNYSAALRQSKIVWRAETLDRWLQKPQTLVPGTTMIFAGVSDSNERKALLQYLKERSK